MLTQNMEKSILAFNRLKLLTMQQSKCNRLREVR